MRSLRRVQKKDCQRSREGFRWMRLCVCDHTRPLMGSQFPELKSGPLAVEMQSLNHWTAREFPV